MSNSVKHQASKVNKTERMMSFLFFPKRKTSLQKSANKLVIQLNVDSPN